MHVSIPIGIFSTLWKTICSYLPSAIHLECFLTEVSSQRLTFTFYLENKGTKPVREYAIKITLPTEVAKHIPNNRIKGPVVISSTNPLIWELNPMKAGGYNLAKSADHPLLPVGPPIPITKLEFYTNNDQTELLTCIWNYPIEVEFWGKSGLKQKRTMYLKQEDSTVRYVASQKPFSAPDKLTTQVFLQVRRDT